MNYISHFQYFTSFVGSISYLYNIIAAASEFRVRCLPQSLKIWKKLKIFAKRFGSLKFVRTFAIPKQSGGGEMVDTLLCGGSGSNPVRVRVSPTAPQRKEENRKVFLFFIIVHPKPGRLNVKSRLFSISARKTALYLAVHRKMMCAPFVGRFNFRYWFCGRGTQQAWRTIGKWSCGPLQWAEPLGWAAQLAENRWMAIASGGAMHNAKIPVCLKRKKLSSETRATCFG